MAAAVSKQDLQTRTLKAYSNYHRDLLLFVSQPPNLKPGAATSSHVTCIITDSGSSNDPSLAQAWIDATRTIRLTRQADCSILSQMAEELLFLLAINDQDERGFAQLVALRGHPSFNLTSQFHQSDGPGQGAYVNPLLNDIAPFGTEAERRAYIGDMQNHGRLRNDHSRLRFSIEAIRASQLDFSGELLCTALWYDPEARRDMTQQIVKLFAVEALWEQPAQWLPDWMLPVVAVKRSSVALDVVAASLLGHCLSQSQQPAVPVLLDLSRLERQPFALPQDMMDALWCRLGAFAVRRILSGRLTDHRNVSLPAGFFAPLLAHLQHRPLSEHPAQLMAAIHALECQAALLLQGGLARPRPVFAAL